MSSIIFESMKTSFIFKNPADPDENIFIFYNFFLFSQFLSFSIKKWKYHSVTLFNNSFQLFQDQVCIFLIKYQGADRLDAWYILWNCWITFCIKNQKVPNKFWLLFFGIDKNNKKIILFQRTIFLQWFFHFRSR